MTLARSTGSVGSWASAGRDESSSAIESTAALTGRLKFFMVKLSSDSGSRSARAFSRVVVPCLAILRARRHDFPARQCDHAEQPGRRAVSRTTGLRSDHLPDGSLDVGLVDVAGAEESGRRPFNGPGFHRASILFHLD